MATYELGTSSADAVTILPEFSYKFPMKQERSQHRTKNGKLFIYKWGEYQKFRVPVTFVSASDTALVNSWWNTNTELLYFVTSGSTTDVYSVFITNAEQPFSQFTKPYDWKFNGKLKLETY